MTFSLSRIPLNNFGVSRELSSIITQTFSFVSEKNKVTDHVSENRHLVPYGTLHSIYQALVQPHFNYCNIVWGNFAGQTAKTTKQSSPFLDLLYDTHVNNLFELLRWKSLVSQRQIERATMVFKSLQGLAPEYRCSKIVHRDSGYCLRDSVNKCSATAHKLQKTALAI